MMWPLAPKAQFTSACNNVTDTSAATIENTESDVDNATLNTTSNAVDKGNHYHHTVTGDREGINNLGNCVIVR